MMQTFSLDFLKPRSHWLVLLTSLAIVGPVILATLFWPGQTSAVNSDIPDVATMMFGAYQSPQRCRECHEEEYQDWSTTTHALASFDPIFQTYLQKASEPGECFACHTTGYNTNSGQFVLAGVTCEACHGPYRPGHPEESMTIARSEDLCGTCHTSTLLEWQTSRHGQVGVTCADCHEVHTQKTRVADTTRSLCAGCHRDLDQDFTHLTHSQLDLHCVDCHLSRPDPDDVGNSVSGHALTGHSFTVSVSECSDCHTASMLPPAGPH